MNKLTIASYIILGLLCIVLLICVLHSRRELFTTIGVTNNTASNNNPLVNLPANDIHFIKDDNYTLIDIPVLNYQIASTLDTTSSTSPKYLSVFQHKPYNIYKGIGQYALLTDEPIKDTKETIRDILGKQNCLCLTHLTSSSIKPIGYNLIWTSDLNKDNQIFSVWHPVPPAGCIALGDIIIMGTEQPSLDLIPCFPITMLENVMLSNGIIWKSINDMGKVCYCWGAGNINTFRCSNIYEPNMSELQSVYNFPISLLTKNTLDTLSNKHNGITI
jgi:hypothetical protein